jgi:Mrp family chromosome partitioning ATPase
LDAIIVVARPDMLKRSMIGELRRLLAPAKAKVLGFVLAGSAEDRGYSYGYGDGYSTRPDQGLQPAAHAPPE